MAGPNFVLDLPYKAAGAIVQFTAVKLSADDTVTPVSATTDVAIGVCQDEVSAGDAAAGRVCDIRVMGVTTWKAGGTVTRGTNQMSSATGTVLNATSTNRVCGIALQSGVSGDWVNVLVVPAIMLAP